MIATSERSEKIDVHNCWRTSRLLALESEWHAIRLQRRFSVKDFDVSKVWKPIGYRKTKRRSRGWYFDRTKRRSCLRARKVGSRFDLSKTIIQGFCGIILLAKKPYRSLRRVTRRQQYHNDKRVIDVSIHFCFNECYERDSELPIIRIVALATENWRALAPALPTDNQHSRARSAELMHDSRQFFPLCGLPLGGARLNFLRYLFNWFKQFYISLWDLII